MSTPLHGPLLDRVRSVKVKLGVLVAASVTVSAVIGATGSAGGVPVWLTVPVTIGLALAVTQLLAVGMTSPLHEMTAAARGMARGDYSARVATSSTDEVGELARAFNRMAEDLAAVDRQRRELVANVSHELRTPLAALCALLENLADGVAEPDPAALRAALDQAERLGALANDLLELSRVDAGMTALSAEQLDLGALLERAIAEARVTARAVTYDLRVSGPLLIQADAARLRQLVANLLDNASRHSPSGGVVRVTAGRSGAGWHLEIADDGPGIPDADRERVFERFGTLSGTDGGGGTGLGLAIARWVTDLHGGSIRFVDPGPEHHGARVRVDVPHEPAARRSPSPSTPQEVVVTTTPLPQPALVPQPPLPSEPGMDMIFGQFWPETDLPGNRRAVLAAAGVGLLAGIVLPFRDLGLGTFLVLLAAGGVILGFSVHRRSRFTLACAGLCVLLASVTMLRDAEWIVVLSLLSGGALCTAALSQGRTLPGFVLAGMAWPLAALRGLPWLGRSLRPPTRLGQAPAMLRTVALSALGVGVFTLLFASADALFAEWVGAMVPDLELDSFVLRAFVTVAVAGLVLAAVYVGLNPPQVHPRLGTAQPVAHRFEWLAPVLLVDLVFVVFLIAQATVIFGGHDYLERTTGLTYADYVHQGFGQLTVATALTLLVVWAAARKAPRGSADDRTWLRGSLGLLCALTLVVVASALYRMHVYQEAYGFTQLRLLVDVFEGWLGLLVLGVMVAGISLRADWLPRAALLSGASLILLLGALNPDAWVAEKNLDRYAETGKVDWIYLQTLSDDAVPVLAAEEGRDRSCALGGRRTSDDDWLEWNLGRSRSQPVIADLGNLDGILCPDGSGSAGEAAP